MVEKKRLNEITEDIIGAGAVVIADILDNATAIGVPAKVINKRGDLA